MSIGYAIRGADWRKRIDSKGLASVLEGMESLWTERKQSVDRWSVMDLAEHLIPNGREFLRNIGPGKSGRANLFEASQSVSTADFSNVIGQIFYTKIREAFDNTELIGDQLVTDFPTTFLGGEKIAGIGRIGDEFEAVAEGHNYPRAGLNEEWVESPAAVKRGTILEVTREAMITDRTGVLTQRASAIGEYLAINKEKRILDVATGQVNNYKRNGTSTNTYLTSGAYINVSTSAALTDWTDIEAGLLIQDQITDPNTGEFLNWGADTLLVPVALKMTAMRIMQATDIRFGDGASNTTAAYGKNPVSNMPMKILSNAYVRNATSSTTTWFMGCPKKAFWYSSIWNIETTQAASNNQAEFERDVFLSYKTTEFGVPWAYEPRYMIKCTA